MTQTNISVESRVNTNPAATRGPLQWVQRLVELRRMGEVGVLVVLVVVFSVLNPERFPTTANLRTILDQAALPLIIGVGATLVILMGALDLSVEGVMGVAGMSFVLLSPNSRGGPDIGLLAIPAALVVGALFGLVTGLIHTQLKVPSFIVTLGMWFVGLGTATVLFGESAQIPFLSDQETVAWTTRTLLGLPRSFLTAGLVVIVGFLLTQYTRFGRVAYAIGNNEAMARDLGIRVDRNKLYVFMAAGVCSALAGVLASIQIGAGAANVGLGTLFLTLAAVVIGGTSLGGGTGGVHRTALGVLILVTLNNGLILAGVSPNIQSAVSGAILIVAIVVAAWPNRGRLRVVK